MMFAWGVQEPAESGRGIFRRVEFSSKRSNVFENREPEPCQMAEISNTSPILRFKLFTLAMQEARMINGSVSQGEEWEI